MMMRSTSRARTAALAVGVLALTMLLAACGGDDSTTGSGSKAGSTASSTGTAAAAPHNDADVAFATGMIPHHGQAVAMAELAATRASSPQVKKLAAAIQAAQGPEIEQMSGWLADWGEEVPDPQAMAMGSGHDMSDMTGEDSNTDGMSSDGMAGMMTADQMSDLAAASGAKFDTMWLRSMIAHHEGAVAMAEDELGDGLNVDALELAETIVDAQQTEIMTMRDLLAG